MYINRDRLRGRWRRGEFVLSGGVAAATVAAAAAAATTALI